MKMTITWSVVLLLGFWGVNAQENADKSSGKEEIASRVYESTKSLIEGKNYEFFADRLIASGGSSRSIAAMPNYIRIEGDEADIYLPYIGEIRGTNPAEIDHGIKYQGPVKNYNVQYKDQKRRVIIRFSTDRKGENHKFIMTVNREGNTQVSVLSGGRTSISYYGKTTVIRDESRM